MAQPLLSDGQQEYVDERPPLQQVLDELRDDLDQFREQTLAV